MKARENPFSTSRILKVRYIPQSASWQEIMIRLADLHHRAAIVGPEGSGKTTLLEDISKHYSRISWFSLAVDLPIPNFDVDPESFVFVDGADLLNRSGWRSLLRIACKGLLVTVHQRMQLPILIECSTNVALLHEVIHKLLGDQANAMNGQLAVLYQKHKGNLRDVLRELYDWWANDQYLDRSFLEFNENFRGLRASDSRGSGIAKSE